MFFIIAYYYVLSSKFYNNISCTYFQYSSLGEGDGWGNVLIADSNIFTSAIGATLVLS